MDVSADTYSYFNRDLNWLKFNDRVLNQAMDTKLPLLERVRFVSIFSNNMDEFFMRRIGFLKRAVATGVPWVGSDQMPPTKLLQEIRPIVMKYQEQRHTL